ncbi:MAG: hypothetical protein J07HQW1_02916 [Haloquadratum walsbyi J07HQW1]|uniref:Uncharacterized protein n=1 Tax=Haloquadratum walsbyi J07HQW1 TaxID=1238424 RepID=U1PGY5_9EURY|nr:MAG: hypothetical protein J07HQW1_02916 [Haloquadratum walsbyi J07HQW1]
MSVSVRPRWNQGVPVWESHNKHRALLTNASNSESGKTDRSSYDTNNTTSSLQLKRGTPGMGLALPRDCSVTGHIPIPTVSWAWAWAWESANPNPNLNTNLTLPLTTRRSGAVGFLPP